MLQYCTIFGIQSQLTLDLLPFVQDFSIYRLYWAVLLYFMQDSSIPATGYGDWAYPSAQQHPLYLVSPNQQAKSHPAGWLLSFYPQQQQLT
ncbi:hypothetical protein [Paenibacillus sp. FSL R7-0179]|uniref:hypothetical protein n=1 Tax=Paenibacillus sp. FSL R7-0179 TaxID=2921672 RepID=UPI0030F52CA5